MLSSRLHWRAIAGILALALVLTACSDTDSETYVAEFPVRIDGETVWQEAFDAFTVDEQACIRSEIDAESLESVLAAPIAEPDVGHTQEIKSIFSCLSTETASSLYFSLALASYLAEDVATDGEPSEDDQAVGTPTPTPTPLPTPTPPPPPTEAPEPPPTVSLVPDEPRGIDTSDDHGDSIAEATPAVVGETVEGAMDYDGDFDFFAFELEADQLYLIDVALGTLGDSVATLYSEDGFMFTSNDDYGGSLASRISWVPDYSGVYYVEVRAFSSEGTGSYTLTAGAAVDDHANSVDGATSAVVGEAVEGEMDYLGDLDVFAFEFEAGQLYQIDVEVDTLSASAVTLYDGDGVWLDNNNSYGSSPTSRIYWEAASSGTHYVEVSGMNEGEGSYTLTVIIR